MILNVKLFRTEVGFRTSYKHGTKHWSGFGETRTDALHSLIDLFREDELRVISVKESMTGVPKEETNNEI